MTTTVTNKSTAYESLISRLREDARLESVLNLVHWDQETMMPAKGARLRADQIRTLSGMVHQRATDPALGELIAECEADKDLLSDDLAAANIREMRRDFDLATKLPLELVQEIAETASLGMDAWKDARKKSDFEAFRPWLEKTVELSIRKAECLGIPDGGETYDPLLDQWEPGMTSAQTEAIFEPLREFTVGLIEQVREAAPAPGDDCARIEFPIDQQVEFTRLVTAAMGFDYDAGRMDVSTHPFCQNIGPGDTRITNRYRPDGWTDALSSGTHETGHAVYEQGLPAEHFGEPLGKYVSLGIHESQSRMYENLMGRSRPFWVWCLNEAQKHFGDKLNNVTADEVYKAVNLVRPHFIRVESDEVTYNLHIMLRFDIERALVRGDLAARDVPGVWNKRMKDDLGLDVTEDRLGCLQDVHWSMGSMGYFPTYTFGNLYAAQFWEAMGRAIPERDEHMSRGEFQPLLHWLRANIHSRGRLYRAPELCEKVTGHPLSAEPLMRHLRKKVEAVYRT